MTTTNDHDRAMTWAALLGKWTEFAQSALALPDDDEGGRLKEAVPAIITLQAVTHACAELGQLEPDERALGADKAEMLLHKNAAELNRIWSGEVMPDAIIEIVEDARLALRAATQGGWEWVVIEEAIITPHPNEILEAMVASGFEGDLFLPTPGVPIFQHAPAAFVRGVEPDSELGRMVFELIPAFLEGAGEPGPVPIARQVYRQFDFSKGGPVRDLVQPMDATLTPGQPLLIPAILAGVVQPISLPIPGTEHQKPLPVEFGASEQV
ncbi:hypothetical protein JYS44_00450 [Phycisphaeraceae bacterium AH-315-B13]|nr:hypothetical protein [Phycisphaeraceae bacterium AH-315-B13]